MKCREIQELLKTNYLDNELKPQEARSIKEHLKECQQCRELEEELHSQHVLFQKTKREKVPEQIWSNIRSAIIKESLNRGVNANPGILERLRELIWGRRPVFVLAGTFAVIIFCVVIIGSLIYKKQSALNGEDILAGYTLSDEGGELSYSFGTNIEEYYL